ncbi:hypothetical protein TNCT_540921 [Trichonephila clavata]|uniref:Uncharacterized protein n=1 Tax=Trichonephila clavata TaxID=2740835 RepID=A0A8X6KQI5_TRICU|nr:hypothetical protein TNCT_540921 [Trichonephila clavata]
MYTSSRKHPKTKYLEKRKFISILQQLLQNSSIQAVSKIGTSPNPFLKIIWMLILVGGLMVSFYQAFRFLNVFLQYPILVTLQIDQKQFLDFPAVTVCNLNRIKKKYLQCLNSNISVGLCDVHGFLPKDNAKPNLVMSERTGLHSCTSEFRGSSDAEKDNTIQFLKIYSALNSKERKKAGYKSEEFIKLCSFNGKSCSAEDFTEFHNLRYGNCFTFNKFYQNKSKPLTISQSGDQSGLVLVLDLLYLYYLNISSTIGARIIIHDPKAGPSPEETGINIAAGYETSLALTQTVITRLPAPYRDHCSEYKNENIWPYHESLNKCVRNCIQDNSFEVCGCADPTLPSMTSQNLCNLTDKSEMCCLDDIFLLLLEGNRTCDCPLPCSTIRYGEKVSVARWPSASSFFTGEAKNTYYPTNFRYFRRSQAKLKIFYSSLTQKNYVQRPMFHESEIYSHLGGDLGIWLGMSLMVTFEIFETVCLLVKLLINFLLRCSSNE